MGARAGALGVMAPWWWLEPCPHHVCSQRVQSTRLSAVTLQHPANRSSIYSVDEETHLVTGLEFQLRTFWPQSQCSCVTLAVSG